MARLLRRTRVGTVWGDHGQPFHLRRAPPSRLPGEFTHDERAPDVGYFATPNSSPNHR